MANSGSILVTGQPVRSGPSGEPSPGFLLERRLRVRAMVVRPEKREQAGRCERAGDRGRTGDVQLGKMSVGVEAAHVKWFNGGPDVVENGLCLCSLHHKAFDLGAIAISDDHKVLVSRDFRGGREWEARFLRVSGAPLVASGRASGPFGVCGVAPQ